MQSGRGDKSTDRKITLIPLGHVVLKRRIEINHIKLLPDTVLLKVFSYLAEEQLCRAARVCLIWRRVAYDSSLWEHVDLRRFHDELDELRLTRLIKSRMIPLLQRLNLGGLSLSPRVFQLLAEHCRKLKTLCLESVTFLDNFSATENSFPESLQSLDVRHTSGNESAFRRIAQNLRGIEFLGISDEFLSNIMAVEELEQLFPRLGNVRILEFSYCTALTDSMIGYIASHCRVLQSLCLRRCNTVQGSSLPMLIDSCILLTSLVLDGTCVNDTSLKSVSWENSVLTEIDLSWCRHLTSEGLKAMLPRLQRLRYLRLCCSGYGHAFTDDVLYQMAANKCKNLEIMDISYSNAVTNNALGRFANVCESLLYLRIHHCRSLTPDVMDLLPGDSKIFVVANFPIDNENMSSLNDELLSRYTHWPTPVYMRDLSLDKQMGWR